MEVFSKNIMDRTFLKQILIISVIFCVSLVIGIGLYVGFSKKVIIAYDGQELVVNTVCGTLGEVLKRNNINYTEDDYLSMSPAAKLSRVNRVIIKKAIPVYVHLDMEKKTIMTYKNTIGEMLEHEGILLGEKDIIEPYSLCDSIEEDMLITVIRTIEKIETIQEDIPFEVIERENPQMNKGINRLIQPGKNGLRENIFKVVIQNGVEKSRQLINSAVITPAINQISEYGTVATYRTSRGEEVAYRKVMNMRATAYTASFKDTGKHPDHPQFGITYTGIRAKRGIIAVDPKVIPLGTKVYVEGVGDVPDYGFALAADIGGAIKGDLIDIYLDDQETVDAWGCKNVRVYILANQ